MPLQAHPAHGGGGGAANSYVWSNIACLTLVELDIGDPGCTKGYCKSLTCRHRLAVHAINVSFQLQGLVLDELGICSVNSLSQRTSDICWLNGPARESLRCSCLTLLHTFNLPHLCDDSPRKAQQTPRAGTEENVSVKDVFPVVDATSLWTGEESLRHINLRLSWHAP
jgi:hypothetical protein